MEKVESLTSQIYQNLNNYLSSFTKDEICNVVKEVNEFSINKYVFETSSDLLDYTSLDDILSRINEKQDIRKKKGVYYTEKDITEFIVKKCITITKKKDFINGSVFDPTCGSGEFLLTSLRLKGSGASTINDIVRTIYGNDLNRESIFITKLRLFLYIFNKYGVDNIKSLGTILNQNFTCKNFLLYGSEKKFDFIVGNPPYVEDKENSKYGNLYADVLDDVSSLVSDKGVIGFIIPLSYVATPRMKSIREKINTVFNSQFIYNFADRPACLFTQVHQKLTILIGKKSKTKELQSGSYQYWYKNDRAKLFSSLETVSNKYNYSDFIPKIGTLNDDSIFAKITAQTTSLDSFVLDSKIENLKEYPHLVLNMRGCFWIKAFLNEHKGNEYKTFYCEKSETRDFLYCLLNSSLFWWFWICISDCWHITSKEFKYFKVPETFDVKKVSTLSLSLENKLEETKKYIGTKQTDYEYKHKLCLEEIHAIDDYVNGLFNLSNEENEYIKNFALTYRTSGGGNQN